MKTYRSFSSEETKEFGEQLARQVTKDMGHGAAKNRALVLALQGDLGAGKTTFTQGFFRGLDIKQRAISPTFVIMRRYKIPGKKPPFSNVYHFDAYRLNKAEDLEVLAFGKIISSPKNILIIEWPERVKERLPKTTIWLKFGHGKKENERKIVAQSISMARKRGSPPSRG